MTTEHANAYETTNPDEMTIEDMVQRIYSENDSLSASIGTLKNDLRDIEGGINTNAYVTMLNRDADNYSNIGPNDKHFTDLVGTAREAAGNEDYAVVALILEKYVIDILTETKNIIAYLTERLKADDDDVFDTIVSQSEYILESYEFLVKTAQQALTESLNNADCLK